MPKQPKRILVVDDEENARIGLSRLLAKEGFLVDSVANGFEALNYLREQEVNLIVTDINMPEMNGITFLKELNRSYIPHHHRTARTAQAAPSRRSSDVRNGLRHLFLPLRLRHGLHEFFFLCRKSENNPHRRPESSCLVWPPINSSAALRHSAFS